MASLTTRWARVEQMARSVDEARASFERLRRPTNSLASRQHLLVRHDFVYRFEPAASTSSDRRVPLGPERPPATRISSSRGSALRLELVALALAQAQHRAGARADNPLPLRPPTRSEVGWVDLLASSAQARGSGKTMMAAIDKKLRQVHTALQKLEEAGLVDLPNAHKTTGIYEDFRLLHEGGARTGTPLPYTVPASREQATVQLPASFVTQGWVHVLEDSEITLLLMVACGLGRIPAEEGVAIPAEVRLLHYGISRDAFGAHRMLSELGLLHVEEVNRNEDGTAMEYSTEGASLHRLSLLPDGFAQEARPTLSEAIQRELDRADA